MKCLVIHQESEMKLSKSRLQLKAKDAKIASMTKKGDKSSVKNGGMSQKTEVCIKQLLMND